MAAASGFPGAREIEKEATCGVCLQLFTRPKELPSCRHTFCQDCIQGVARNLKLQKKPFQCPICRHEVELPQQGVTGLLDNCTARSLSERLKNLTKLSEETREQPRWKPGNRCSFHPSEEVKLYCKQCNEPVCSECCEESHDGHPTTGIKKAAGAFFDEIESMEKGYNNFFTQLDEQQKTLDEQKKQREKGIIKAYTQAEQKLIERKELLLTESQQNHREGSAKIDQERKRAIEGLNELVAARDQAKQEQQQGVFKFLNQQTTLTEVVGKYSTLTPVQIQPAVFQPTDTPVPVLGHVTVQSLPSGEQSKSVWYVPVSEAEPVSSDDAAGGTGHHQGNQEQEEHQPQRVTFGKRGAGKGQLKKPHGVTVSDEEEIFVADNDNYRIQVFTLQGTYVRQFPTVVPGEQNMTSHDVALDGEGNLWVVGSVPVAGSTDSANFAVQYDKQGRVLTKFDLKKTGCGRGVAVDTRRNHILITQTTGKWPKRNGEVQMFRPDGTRVEGKWKNFKVSIGVSRQGMKYPWYITVDSEGNILVSDYDNHCVFVYNKDGQFLFKFGGEGSGEGQLKEPRGICSDKSGNIIVADTGNNRVEMFDKTGKFLKHIATDMKQPCAVAMATQGQLIVTDYREHTVTIFQNY